MNMLYVYLLIVLGVAIGYVWRCSQECLRELHAAIEREAQKPIHIQPTEPWPKK